MADSLLQEVDDALRADKLYQLWRDWRGPMLWGAIALIIATAGQSVWNNYKEKRAQHVMADFLAAQELYKKSDFDGAAKGFAALASNNGGDIHDFSLLWQARVLVAADKKDDAVAALVSLADNPEGSDLIWRDLACLRLAGLSDKVIAACDTTKNSPLKAIRDEWHAARLWQAGKTDEARNLLKAAAKDPATTASQRARLQDLLSTLGPAEKPPAK